jgi:hypothetical protein
MGTNPLDTAFAGASARKQSKRGIAYMAILGVAGLASASSVFAASVNINNSAAISFTQGTQVIAPCDTGGITVALGATFDGTEFVLDTVSLADISHGTGSSANNWVGCDNKTLTVRLYDSTDHLVTMTGVLDLGSAGTVIFGATGAELEEEAGNSPLTNTYTLLDGTRDVAYQTVSSVVQDAADLASLADRIVVEIN